MMHCEPALACQGFSSFAEQPGAGCSIDRSATGPAIDVRWASMTRTGAGVCDARSYRVARHLRRTVRAV